MRIIFEYLGVVTSWNFRFHTKVAINAVFGHEYIQKEVTNCVVIITKKTVDLGNCYLVEKHPASFRGHVREPSTSLFFSVRFFLLHGGF